MATRQVWLLSGMVLSLFACDVLRADEPGTKSTVTVLVTNSRPVVRGTRRYWSFGGATYMSVTTVPGTSSTSTPATTAPVKTTTRLQDSQQRPLQTTTPSVQAQPSAPAASTQLSTSIFGSGAVPTSQLSQERRSRATVSGSDVVSGRESGVRATTDAGSLLGRSSSARGISTQQRTPIMTDTRIRGSGVGRMVASGG